MTDHDEQINTAGKILDLMAAIKESMAKAAAGGPAASPEPIDVVAAVRQHEGRYWVCRRTDDGSHGGLAGMWEYPGGKVEPGETLTGAMQREMREEFDVECTVGKLLDTIVAESEGRRYRVHFFEVTFLGTPTLLVHDQAEWLGVRGLLAQQHLPSGTEFNKRLASPAVPAAAPALPTHLAMLLYETRPPNIWVGHGGGATFDHCRQWADRVRARLAPPVEERPT